MSWDEDIQRVVLKLDAAEKALLPAVGAAVLDSIQNGSAVTGSPGQPVGQYGPGYHPGEVGGTLKASWSLTFPSPTEAMVTTNLIYAHGNETGVTDEGTPYVQRSTVGGRHSVALTRVGIQALVDNEAKRLRA